MVNIVTVINLFLFENKINRINIVVIHILEYRPRFSSINTVYYKSEPQEALIYAYSPS